jgi:ribonuclease Z
VVLGTASQVPTATRNHNGYLLRWDGQGLLFDPGEGTQRQLTLAGVSPTKVTAICITHAHGDHCLGLPGVLQRLSLEGVTGPVPLVYPAAAEEYIRRLRKASAYDDRLAVQPHPVTGAGWVLSLGDLTLEAAPLQHRVPTFGYRVVEADGVWMLPDRLAERGITGPAVGQLQREGVLQTEEGRVHLSEVSARRPGQRFAFVMDTADCAGARTLAEAADMVVSEATFADAESHLAVAYTHLTARQAAGIARDAGARLLVLTHFSQRYADVAPLLAQAAEVFADVVAAEDLARIPVPRRIRRG